MKKNKFKNFITNGEFYPNFRSIYAHIKSLKQRPKIIMVNHADYHKDNLFLYLNKKILVKKPVNIFDVQNQIYFSQGTEYAKYLKGIFSDKKIYIVGSFKFDLIKHINKKKLIIKNIKKISKGKNKGYSCAYITERRRLHCAFFKQMRFVKLPNCSMCYPAFLIQQKSLKKISIIAL